MVRWLILGYRVRFNLRTVTIITIERIMMNELEETLFLTLEALVEAVSDCSGIDCCDAYGEACELIDQLK